MKLLRDEQGFTLVETLISFVILSGALILAFQVMADGLSALKRADEKSRNATVISAEAERLIVTRSLNTGTLNGETDGVAWSIIAAPIAGEASPQYQVQPWLITAHDKDGLTVFQTISLAGSPQ